MLQFFDDLPNDRWAALWWVERHYRKGMSEAHSLDDRSHYAAAILTAAHELKLIVLPEWQARHQPYQPMVLSDEDCAKFHADLDALMPKVRMLAGRGTAPRLHPYFTLDIRKE